MQSDKIKMFIHLAGQKVAESVHLGDEAKRRLGAQLLLSEVLEYVIKGLGVVPSVNGVDITDANNLVYKNGAAQPDKLEMLDGLADVAYTMYWNACAFGMPLEEAFEAVCDNNLEKFVKLSHWSGTSRPLERQEWDLGLDVKWPEEVVQVEVLQVNGTHFAVGKDSMGKVRKPSTYASVDLTPILEKA